MDSESLTLVLSKMGYKYKIMESSVDLKYILVRVAFSSNHPPEVECDDWIQKFSAHSATNWITNTTFPNIKRFKYRKLYDCQHSSRYKSGNPKYKLSGRSRDKCCQAKIDIHVKLETIDTLKKDILLKEGLNAVVKVSFEHSHLIDVAEAYSFLRMNKNSESTFIQYFDDGMSPSAAKTYHEIRLMSFEEDDKDIISILANSQINPTNRQVSYLYDKWRKTNYGDRDSKSVVQILKEKQSKLSEIGVEISVQESPLIVVVVTPVMRRAHKLDFSGEIVFVDSSGSCDQTNSCVTFMFGATKVGAVPLACVIHTSLSEENYFESFSAIKTALGENCFNGKGYPDIFMTDDSAPERNALKNVFPCSTLLLCTFHVCQAIWRWLWDSDHGIHMDDRKKIMDEFRKVIYEPNIKNCGIVFQLMLESESVKKYDNYTAYITNFWSRKLEWALCYRQELITRGHNTNNFVEASIRIFKDIVLERCKSFNACALVDFIGNVFESYHKRKLMKFANRRVSRPDLVFMKVSHKAKDLKVSKIDDNLFHIESSENADFSYLVQSDIGLCDCPDGNGGNFCKHLCAVQIQFNKFLPNNPTLSPADCVTYAKLAFGENVNEDFFRSMSSTKSKARSTAAVSKAIDVEDVIVDESINTSTKHDSTEQDSFQENIENLRNQVARICEITTNNFSPSLSNGLVNFTKVLERIDTPSQVEQLLFSINNRTRISSRHITVQPTGIARRKKRNGLKSGSKRIQAGRPSNIELGRIAKKRVRNLARNIRLNKPNAKSHGRSN